MSAAAPETAFADLLRTFGATQPPASAEAFEANDLVGRAELSLISDAAETDFHVGYRQVPAELAAPSAQITQGEPSVLSLESELPEARSAHVDIRSFAAGPHSFFSEISPTGKRESAAPALAAMPSTARLPDATLQPTRSAITNQLSFAPASGKLATTVNIAQPPQPAGAVNTPISLPPAPRERATASPVAKPADNSAADKVRNLILEHAQANTCSVHVAVLAADSGLRVVARVGAMQDAERLRLKESITAMLAERGFTDIDIVIQTSSPADAGAKQG
jgi:hypothetical protein